MQQQVYKKNKIINQQGWINVQRSLDSNILTSAFIASSISSFWSSIVSKLDPNQYLFVLFIVEYENKQFKTLGKTNKVCCGQSEDMDTLIEAIQGYFSFSFDSYQKLVPVSIIIRYKLIDESELIGSTSIIHEAPVLDKSIRSVPYTSVGDFDLPNTMT